MAPLLPVRFGVSHGDNLKKRDLSKSLTSKNHHGSKFMRLLHTTANHTYVCSHVWTPYFVRPRSVVRFSPEHASAHRAYIMFRTLGLRHLVVVNHYNEVMGMITRENLLPEHFGAGGAYSRTQDVPDKLSAA